VVAEPEPIDLDGRQRRFLVLGLLAGSAGIGVLPLSLLIPSAVLLVVLLPLAVAAFGIVRQRAWLMNTGLAVFAVLLVGILVAPSAIGPIVALLGSLGPLAVAYLGGDALLRVDRIAAGAWLGSATVAVVFGFAAASIDRPGAAVIVIVVLAIGAVAATVRVLQPRS
jgi:hypothetical protein